MTSDFQLNQGPGQEKGAAVSCCQLGVVQVSYSVSVYTEQGDAPCPGSYLTLRGLEGRGCLASAPQLFSADGVEGLASLLPGHYPVVTEPNGGAGGHLIDPGGAGSSGSPCVICQPE